MNRINILLLCLSPQIQFTKPKDFVEFSIMADLVYNKTVLHKERWSLWKPFWLLWFRFVFPPS